MWWILITVILGILLYLLLAPIQIVVDSENNKFLINFHRLINASILLKNASVFLRLNIIGFKKEYNLFEQTQWKKNKLEYKIKTKSKKSLNIRKVFRKTIAVIGSFKIKRCLMAIDTGDMALNGILYPWFYLISLKYRKTIIINFIDENKIDLKIENNIARILWAYIIN